MINLTKKLRIIEDAFKLMNQRRRVIVEEYYFGNSEITKTQNMIGLIEEEYEEADND